MGPCQGQASTNGSCLLKKIERGYGSATHVANHFCLYQDQKIPPPHKFAHLHVAERIFIDGSGIKTCVLDEEKSPKVWKTFNLKKDLKIEAVHSHLVCHAVGHKLRQLS